MKLLIDTKDLLTIEEARQALHIGYATIYRWIKVKKIRPVKLDGRTLITKDEVERLKGG